jgi:hypothetical protein
MVNPPALALSAVLASFDEEEEESFMLRGNVDGGDVVAVRLAIISF